MTILQRLGRQFQSLFPATEHGQNRVQWFLLTLHAILLAITASRTSNLVRSLASVFGLLLDQTRYYTSMASPNLPCRIWECLWRSIPDPVTDGRLLLALPLVRHQLRRICDYREQTIQLLLIEEQRQIPGPKAIQVPESHR